jgi:undecaprenyl-diphosphatase
LGQPAKIKYSRSAGLEDVEGRSFPSAHTTNMIAVALVTACFYRRWGWLAFIPALLVAYSRIYTGSHWPSDIVTSIFLSLGSTLLLLCALEWLWRKHGAKLLPAIHDQHPSLLAA